MNEHPENIEIHEAIVGNPIDVFGTKTENRIHPKDLPNCDVLTMDIEGSEISVLKELTIRPRAIVVESHGLKGSPTQKIAELVENLGYNVTNTEIDSSERSIDIITAKLDGYDAAC